MRVSGWKSATRTKARVAWKVVLCCSNRTSICSHALILLSQTRLDCGSLLYASICLHPVFQTRLDYGSSSAHTHQTPALCFKHVWFLVPCLCASTRLQPFDQTCLDCGSFLYTSIVSTLCFKRVWIVVPCLRTRISLQPCVSNTFGLWFPVCAHASVYSSLVQTRSIMVACLFTLTPAPK